MLKEFREFAMKGSLIDMAVGIIIGLAFGAIVQSLVAEAKGIDVFYIPSKRRAEISVVKRYFSKDTMSLHLKSGIEPYVKRGKPGESSMRPNAGRKRRRRPRRSDKRWRSWIPSSNHAGTAWPS